MKKDADISTAKVTGMQCVRCGEQHEPDYPGMICAACGGNLDVTYDYSSVDPQNWMIDRDDIFRYRALLPICGLDCAPSQRVGMTPLYHAKRAGGELGLDGLYIKDDGLNPSASFKDRASAVAIVCAHERGAEVIAGATTGNAGSSTACLSAGAGVPAVIFVPEAAPEAKITQLLVFGAKVVAVRGNYDQAYDLCAAVCDRLGWFNRNTGYNPFTREGKKTCSFEVWEQLGGRAPDHMLVCTGDGNIISGIWKGFRDLKALGLIDRLPKLYCVQSERSAAISRAIEKLPAGYDDWKNLAIEPVKADTIADSISVDDPRDGVAAVRAVVETGGRPLTVSEDAIVQAIPELARKTGVFAEPAAAASWAGLKKLAGEGGIGAGETVVCLISGNGLKDISRARAASGTPLVVDADVDSALRDLPVA